MTRSAWLRRAVWVCSLPLLAQTEYPALLLHHFNGRPPLPEAQIQALARRDVIVLAPAFRKDSASLARIRRLNPKIVILQYALTFQVAYDEAAPLSNDEEVALFRDYPESWLVTAPVASLEHPVTESAAALSLSRPLPAAFTHRGLPLLLCGGEVMRVERTVGGQVQVLRGRLGTRAAAHAAGAPVTVVTQPSSWAGWYHGLTPRSEVVHINISDRAPRAAGRRPWEIKAGFLARQWADPEWRGAFDGFFLDEGQARVEPAWIDLDRDGKADRPLEVLAGMERGTGLLARRLRERCGPALVLVFNNRDNIIPEASGRHREHFCDMRAPATGWGERFVNWTFSVEPSRAWMERGHAPAFVLHSSQPGTWDDYRQVRLGLASTLLFGGYFQYRAFSGDQGNWKHWYDEFSVDAAGRATSGETGRHWLGRPLGPARQVVMPAGTANLLHRADWELRLAAPPAVSADLDQQGDTVRASLRGISFAHAPQAVLWTCGTGPLAGGREYTLAAEVRASPPRLVDVALCESSRTANAPAVLASLFVGEAWNRRVLTLFVPPDKPLPAFDLEFHLGRDGGDFELGDLVLREGASEAGWLREFEHGLVVVNPTRQARTLSIPTGFRRIAGTQDAAHNNGRIVGSRLEVGPLDAYLLPRIAR